MNYFRYCLKTTIEKISVKWKSNEFCLEFTAVRSDLILGIKGK